MSALGQYQKHGFEARVGRINKGRTFGQSKDAEGTMPVTLKKRVKKTPFADTHFALLVTLMLGVIAALASQFILQVFVGSNPDLDNSVVLGLSLMGPIGLTCTLGVGSLLIMGLPTAKHFAAVAGGAFAVSHFGINVDMAMGAFEQVMSNVDLAALKNS